MSKPCRKLAVCLFLESDPGVAWHRYTFHGMEWAPRTASEANRSMRRTIADVVLGRVGLKIDPRISSSHAHPSPLGAKASGQSLCRCTSLEGWHAQAAADKYGYIWMAS